MHTLAVTYAAASLLAFYWVGTYFYNAFFHPLKSYPGPKLCAVSGLPLLVWRIRGCLPYRVKELHDIYGDVVRIGPNYLDYKSSTAWEDIYGFPKDGKVNFPKDFRERGGGGSTQPVNM